MLSYATNKYLFIYIYISHYYHLQKNSWNYVDGHTATGSICHMPYLDSVAPDQHVHSYLRATLSIEMLMYSYLTD